MKFYIKAIAAFLLVYFIAWVLVFAGISKNPYEFLSTLGVLGLYLHLAETRKKDKETIKILEEIQKKDKETIKILNDYLENGPDRRI